MSKTRYTQGTMTVRSRKVDFHQKIEYGDQKHLGLSDLHEIFAKFPPDNVLIIGDFVTDEIRLCWKLATKSHVTVTVKNEDVRRELESLT